MALWGAASAPWLCTFYTIAAFAGARVNIRRLAGAPGFEPGNGGTKNRCLTTWRRPSSPVVPESDATYRQTPMSGQSRLFHAMPNLCPPDRELVAGRVSEMETPPAGKWEDRLQDDAAGRR